MPPSNPPQYGEQPQGPYGQPFQSPYPPPSPPYQAPPPGYYAPPPPTSDRLAGLRPPRRRPDQRGLRPRAEQGQAGAGRPGFGDRRAGAVWALGGAARGGHQRLFRDRQGHGHR